MKFKFPKLMIEHLWVLLTLGACFGYLCVQPVDQLDFWHYLKAGDVMLCSHKFLTVDQFTFTIQGMKYINVHWLSEILYSIFYRLGGIQLIILVHAIVVTSSFGLLLLVVNDKVKDLRISSFAVFIAFILSSTNLTLRPQSFSILFFILTLYLLKRKCLWLIPFVILLWTNVHAAFMLGLVLIGIEWITSLKRSLFIVLLISFLTTLCNPYGYKFYQLVFSVEAVSRKLCHISEWETPSFHEPTGLRFYLALLVLVALHNFRKTRLSWNDLLIFLFFTASAFSSLRTILWWSIISAPLFAVAIKEVMPVKTTISTPSRITTFANWCIVILFCGYLISFLPWVKAINPILPKNKKLLLVEDTPVLISEKLKNISSIHNIFNDYSWGSYFIWALRNDQKVFYDPRAAIFPPKVLSDYFKVSNGDRDWQEVLENYKVDALVLNKEQQEQLISQVLISNKWKQIYEDKLGYIFVRGL